MRVREPVARPLDVVAVELLLSASQAFLVGVLLYLAVGIWDDRGVAIGPVAIILAMLGLAVGGAWLYWLMGGMGWPLAAANVPTAMFLGFVLILGWQGDDLIRLDGVPLVLALAASILGVVGGVFLDSPRRWRWDQRQRPREGAEVPRVSPTGRAVAARVPRSLSPRSGKSGAGVADGAGTAPADEVPDSPEATRTADFKPDPSPASGDVSVPYVATAVASEVDTGRAPSPSPNQPTSPSAEDRLAGGSTPGTPSFAASITPLEPSVRAGSDDDPAASPSGDAVVPNPSSTIELPTSVEPKAQRSPWAWAAPPEWNRDEEEDEPNSTSSAGR